MNYLLEKTFENRGYTSEFLESINCSEHRLLEHIDTLCEKLHEIHESGHKIVIYPDYDMDGIAAGVCNFAGLSELGFAVSLFIPNPEDGYGISISSIDRLMMEYPDVHTILTCDVGVSEQESITYARSLGVQVLVTDHHIQKEGDVSAADVLVDPMSLTDTYEHPFICGAYVAYQCLERYVELYGNGMQREQISRLRVFAGIGTISDTMPVLYENRQLILDMISISRMIFCDGDDMIVNMVSGCDVYRRAFYGLYIMLKVFYENGVITNDSDITESFFGYYFAPSFNSVKRMEGDLSRAFLVFFGADPMSHAEYLIQLNSQRKTDVARYMQELMESDQPYAPFVYLSDAPSGILGLLAQKLLTDDKPVIVLRKDDSYHGSGRSPEWYPFFDRATAADFYVGGHNPAFGIGLKNKKEIQRLITFLKTDVDMVSSQVEKSVFVPDFVISQDGHGDTPIDILLFREYLSELEYYHPFGKGFPAPSILLRFTKQESEWSYLGKTRSHLKIRLPYGFTVLLWNQANMMHLHDDTDVYYVLGHLELNEFNGVHTMNFVGEFI